MSIGYTVFDSSYLKKKISMIRNWYNQNKNPTLKAKNWKYLNGLGAKILKNRSAAPPRKKNSIATMHQVYIYGAWKTMFY